MEQFALRLAGAQARDGHDVTLAALHGGPLLDEARRLGVRTEIIGGGDRFRRAWEMGALFRRLRPDVVHAHNPSALPYSLLGRFASGARVVMTRHGQDASKILTPLQWRYTDAVVAVSHAAASVMQANSGMNAAKIRVIRNGVEFSEAARNRSEVRRDLGLGEEPVGIIVARLDRMKGHDCLLRALALLPETCPVTVLAIGDGAEMENLRSLAAELRLGPERVRFLGYRSDIPDLLGASDFFLLPSLTEGLPLAVLEAMAHGLPVLATPVGGIPEVVQEGEQGLFVPVNDPEALAGAMARLAEDPALRRTLGEAGCRRVREHFSFRTMTAEYERLYRSLCGQGKR
jgi:glycosyltransferase involved in cell wall biosynthesis